MRLTALIFVFLIVLSHSMTIKKSTTNYKNIETLKKDKSWSKIVLNLAELHMMSDFPLSDLVEAIE